MVDVYINIINASTYTATLNSVSQDQENTIIRERLDDVTGGDSHSVYGFRPPIHFPLVAIAVSL